MKRKNAIAEAASKTPSVVLRAFAPDTEFTLTLDGWIFMEALGSTFTSGGKPTLADMVLAALVMTDESAVFAARKANRLDALIKSATFGKRPGDIMRLADRIKEGIDAAFDPADTGADVGEKKSSAGPAGG